ncbi:MAG: hypothetical protein A4E65_03023 [Syntrophorhabdus sp. PtaU1.Bin153]|nr:MAG: hypothetical protein A4E65_03023 [Syntrophorhabdus sp. PtaU1.Bin153]
MNHLQHVFNGLRIRAFLQRLGVSRIVARGIALYWEGLINPVIYRGKA